VGGRERIRGPSRPLPKGYNIEAEQLTEAALGIQDLAVYLTCGQIDKFQRKIDEQRLETTSLFNLCVQAGVLSVHPILTCIRVAERFYPNGISEQRL
jgi:hypothetical protein